MKVAEHLIRAPTANKADDIRINFSNEKRSGPGGAKTAGRDVGGEEPKVSSQVTHSLAQERRDSGRSDTGARVEHPGQWGVWACIFTPQVEDAADQRLNWTEIRITTAAETNDFATHAIFLFSEGQGSEAGEEKLAFGSSPKVQACSSNKELDVIQGEWSGIGGRVCVFARP